MPPDRLLCMKVSAGLYLKLKNIIPLLQWNNDFDFFLLVEGQWLSRFRRNLTLISFKLNITSKEQWKICRFGEMLVYFKGRYFLVATWSAVVQSIKSVLYFFDKVIRAESETLRSLETKGFRVKWKMWGIIIIVAKFQLTLHLKYNKLVLLSESYQKILPYSFRLQQMIELRT